MTETIKAERQIRYCVACGCGTERYTRNSTTIIGRCIPCQRRRSANSSAVKKRMPETPPPIAKSDRKEWRKTSGNIGRPAKTLRNKAVMVDINGGMEINEAAVKYKITRQYILIVIRNQRRIETGETCHKEAFAGLYAVRDNEHIAHMGKMSGNTTVVRERG